MSIEANATHTSPTPGSSLPATACVVRLAHSRPRLMLVDDNDTFLSAMELLLPRLFDVEIVASTASALEALDRLQSTSVDLVIVDYKMPGLNGLSFVRRARQQHYRARILIVTFSPEPTLEKDARECGADGVINKAEIQAGLKDHLHRCFGCQMRPPTSPLV